MGRNYKHRIWTTADYDEMERRRKAGETFAEIAKDYGVYASLIRGCIVHRWQYNRRIWHTKVVGQEVIDGCPATSLAIYKGDELRGTMLFDSSMEPDVLDRVWRLNKYGYAVTGVEPTHIPYEFHRLFFPAPKGLVCDHINRNRLDNRRSNIRHTTQKINVRNCDRWDNAAARLPKPPPKYRPVGSGSIHRRFYRYEALLAGKYLGMFATPEEAQQAIDQRWAERLIERQAEKEARKQAKMQRKTHRKG